MSNKNKVIVRIHGQEYTMVGKESREYIQSIANFVDDKMTEIAQSSKVLSTSMIAVLTALNIADEYFKMKKRIKELEEEYAKVLGEAKGQIAAALSEFEIKELDYKKEIKQLEEENKNIIQNNNKKCDEFIKEVNKLESELTSKESEIDQRNKKVEELQNKVHENQSKYVQAKKELDAFIEMFDEKT